jgi:hypothetical protein
MTHLEDALAMIWPYNPISEKSKRRWEADFEGVGRDS